jgi:ubiquinone/menaquinone biosynthesis C-methylase UbiE
MVGVVVALALDDLFERDLAPTPFQPGETTIVDVGGGTGVFALGLALMYGYRVRQ